MFRSILVPVDGSALSQRALPLAVDLAQRAGARLVLMRATEEADQSEASAYLEQIGRDLGRNGLDVDWTTPTQAPALAILDQIERQDADLVVMTTHGRSGLGKLLFGSVAETVLARSPAPLLMIRAGGEATTLGTLSSIELLVPLDGSGFAESALGPARKLARALRGSLILLHALPQTRAVDRLALPNLGTEPARITDMVEARTYLGDWAERLRLEGVAARTVVCYGDPANVIVGECQKAQTALIVMATHGRSGRFDRPFGSVAIEVLRRTGLPALLVRPQPDGARPVAAREAVAP